MIESCQICLGTRGGVPGNGNIVNGICVCDYCHADILRGRPLVVVRETSESRPLLPWFVKPADWTPGPPCSGPRDWHATGDQDHKIRAKCGTMLPPRSDP